MGNINSYNIRVFPTTLRTTYDASSRLTTEYNLTSIINRLIDQESFVVSPTVGQDIFQFNIKGYLFTVYKEQGNAQELIISAASASSIKDTSIYAVINIKDEQDGTATTSSITPLNTWWQLQGEDSKDQNPTYEGVGFTTTPPPTPPPSGQYYLKILEHNGTSWQIPQESKIKFKTDQEGFRSVTIDDGVL